MRLIMAIVLALIWTSLCFDSDSVVTADQRLTQPVTIECVNTRLHTVLEQLSDKTGVAIRCGRDKRDWQVRDIPVTVCAKDVPIGRLLQSIASSTHLLLSKEQVGQTTIYRIWRDKKRRDQIDGFFSARREAAKARAEWDWDALCKAAGTLEDGESNGPVGSFASLLAGLGAGGKNQAMSGGITQVNLATAPDALRRPLDTVVSNTYRFVEGAYPPIVTPELMQECGIIVGYVQDDEDLPHVAVNIRTPHFKSGHMIWMFRLGSIAQRALAQDSPDAPKPPEDVQPPAFVAPDGQWIALSDEADWDLPMLRKKISLRAPEDEKTISTGSLLAALSRESGFAVICEDFESHRVRVKPKSLFKNDTTVGEVLKGLVRSSPEGRKVSRREPSFVWHINEQDKLIIGTSIRWPFDHTSLVSTDFLAYFRAKLNGDGVGLDDYLKVVALTPDQVSDWIACDPDLAILDAYKPPTPKGFWLLYDSLTPAQKAQAQTHAGLPISDLQPNYLAYLLSCYNQSELAAARLRFDATEPKQFPYDDRSMAGLVMKVVRKEKAGGIPRSWSNVWGERNLYPVGGEAVDVYTMILEITQNGKTQTLELTGPAGLPLFSAERQAQLREQPAK